MRSTRTEKNPTQSNSRSFGKIMQALRYFLLVVAAGLAAVLIADIAFLGTAMTYLREGRMAYGLTMGGRNIGGMTREEAAKEVAQGAKKALAGDALVLSLNGGEKTFSYSAEEVGLAADMDAMLDSAYQTGRSGSSFQNFYDAVKCALNGKEVFAEVRLNETRLTETLNRVKEEVDRPPVDATVAFTATGIIPREGTTGRQMNVAALKETVTPKLLGLHLPCREAITLVETEPEVTLKDVESIDGVLGSCTTYYGADTGRGDNIEIATAALNNRIVHPGEELSFNTQVGPRVPSRGYEIAPVIVDGKVEQDTGGGVCQVSSTLYNAVLTADLTPTARTAHFYPSTYVDAGLDATVADGQIDFVFQNTLPHPVLLRSSASNGTLTVSVYGHTADLPGEIEMESVIIGPPPTVEVYRLTYVGDKLVSREYLYTDEYDVPPPPEDEKPSPAANNPSPSPVPDSAPTPKPAPEPAPSPEPAPEPVQPTKPTAQKPPAQPATPGPAPARPATPQKPKN